MLKVIELFAGVGSQTQALKNIGVEHEVVGISEIDKHAIKSYMQLHGETHNFGDISKIEKLPKADLWTYSFPCQDLSVIGAQKGIKQGTRSGLLLEVERLLECSEKPKYLLMENVKNLLGAKHKEQFYNWCKKLEELGYVNYYKILNAKDYGVPQNRERVFMVSILGDDVDFEMPNNKRNDNDLTFGDIVNFEMEVPERIIQAYSKKQSIFKKRFSTRKYDDVASCLVAKSTYAVITNNYYTEDFKKYNLDEIIALNKKVYCLTTYQYWQLMGWTKEQFNKIKGVSEAQLYKQAGNGIVVNVLEAIFKNMFRR